MKISHDWLRGFVPHTLTAKAVGELLSRHVATLDGAGNRRADLAKIVVARVIASEKVPETRLSYNKVDDGSGTLLDVVCGAPNVTVGTLYPFARVGTLLPNGILIEVRKIRGMTSHGMLCSADEIKLGTDHDGIMPLDVDVAPGTPLLDALPLGDTVLELDVLPNRPDLLSHIGLAREIAALTNGKVGVPAELQKLPAAPKATVGKSAAKAAGASVKVDDLEGCPRYVAVVVRGVKVGPSPAWLAERVEAMGGRSINNVVDATNYILHGFGHPVHAFDLAKLAGNAIVVRKAHAGESLVTLDGTTHKLESWMTIIADGERATALAGVMGGRESEVTEATTDLLVEVAVFAPRNVRAVRKKVGLNTDASYRFERGVDAGATLAVAARAAGLIASVAGGTIAGIIDVGSAPATAKPVSLHPTKVSRLVGAKVGGPEVKKLLTSIGFAVKAGKEGAFAVTAPSWRHDVSRDVDLVEEIARLRGYDTLSDDISPFRAGTAPDHPLHHTGRRVRDVLVAAGFLEARSMPFTRGGANAAEYARVTNPLAADEPFLRRTLLDTLARRAEHNLNRHQGDVRLFELGSTFEPRAGALPHEEVHVGAILMGGRRPPHFTEPKPPSFDAWDAKEIGALVARAAFPGHEIALFAGGGGALWSITASGTVVGTIDAVSLDAPVWAAPAFGIEITLGVMSSAPAAPPGTNLYLTGRDEAPWFPTYTPIPVTPAAEFDLALIVPDSMPASTVDVTIRASAGELLESLVLFDEYRGEGVPAGARSLGWRLTFRHPERTLRDKEIDGRRSQLLKTLEKEIGVRARTSETA